MDVEPIAVQCNGRRRRISPGAPVQLCHRRGKNMSAEPQAAIVPGIGFAGDLTPGTLRPISPPMNSSFPRAIFSKWRRRKAWRHRARPRAFA
jgi:hypothetical protein